MLQIVRTHGRSPEILGLIELLDADLVSRYGPIQAEFDPHNKVDKVETAVVALWDRHPVGCGCFRPLPESTVEIKRMYVRPEHRGKGIAVAIMQELEAWAIELGTRTAVLETGLAQPEAIALYRKMGYTQIENYPPYVDVAISMCMGKRLD